jgi:hypothetical protein
MCRKYSIILSLLVALASVGFGMQAPKPSEESGEFQWLDDSGTTAGTKFATQKLRSLSIEADYALPVEIESEKEQVDAQTTRITRSTFSDPANSGRQLVETTVEEIKKMPDGRVSAVRTTSRRDANGRLSVIQKETQEVVSSGTDSYRITKTLLQPGINSSLVEKAQVLQIEKRAADKSVEIDRIRYEPGPDGKLNAAERRVSQNVVGKDRAQTDEQVYRYDINQKVSLTQQLKINEWKDSAGQVHHQSESYAAGLNGKLQLDSRSTIVQKSLGNQKQETTEIVEGRNTVSPGEGLRVVRKAVENVRPLSASETERQLEVFEPDLNGGMKSAHTQQTIDRK